MLGHVRFCYAISEREPSDINNISNITCMPKWKPCPRPYGKPNRSILPECLKLARTISILLVFSYYALAPLFNSAADTRKIQLISHKQNVNILLMNFEFDIFALRLVPMKQGGSRAIIRAGKCQRTYTDIQNMCLLVSKLLNSMTARRMKQALLGPVIEV